MRRHPPPGSPGACVVVALVAAIVGSAFAYFTTAGLGTAKAEVSKLTTPTITAASAAVGGTVSLTWSASTAPDAEAVVKYYVTRDGEDPGGTCAAPAVPTAAVSCKDSELEVGKHTYAVTAVWRSWSATSTTSSATVTIGAATHFVVTAASLTPGVSVADNLTITAKDEKESTVTTYTGSHSLVFSGASSSPGGTAPTVANSSGTATAFGSATALTFTTGVASVTSSKNGVLKIYKAGAASIVATEGALTTTNPLDAHRDAGRRRRSTCWRRRRRRRPWARTTTSRSPLRTPTATPPPPTPAPTTSSSPAPPPARAATLPTVTDSAGNDDRLRHRDADQLQRRSRHVAAAKKTARWSSTRAARRERQGDRGDDHQRHRAGDHRGGRRGHEAGPDRDDPDPRWRRRPTT